MTLQNNSVAIVTGAGSGIGRELAIQLANEPIKGLVLTDISDDTLAETVKRIDSATKVLTKTADVSDRDSFKSIREEAITEFGTVSHIFNNAGAGMIGRVDEVSIEDMEWLVNVNFWGTVYGTKEFLPVFQEQGYGHIINISSVFGFIAPPGQATYCATKFAVRGFTESLRHELVGTNIVATSVHPGGIRTNIAREARLGAKAPAEDKEIAPAIFEKICRTNPDEAAATIIRGVKKRKTRILIGSDAYQISWIQRLFPLRYFNILDRLSGGQLSRFR